MTILARFKPAYVSTAARFAPSYSAAAVTAYYAGTTAAAAGWTSSLGGNLDLAINETTFDDANWIESSDLTTPSPNIPWAPASLPIASFSIDWRGLKTQAGGQIRIVLLNSGGTVINTGAWHAQGGAFAAYNDAFTTTDVSTHFRLEVQP